MEIITITTKHGITLSGPRAFMEDLVGYLYTAYDDLDESDVIYEYNSGKRGKKRVELYKATKLLMEQYREAHIELAKALGITPTFTIEGNLLIITDILGPKK